MRTLFWFTYRTWSFTGEASKSLNNKIRVPGRHTSVRMSKRQRCLLYQLPMLDRRALRVSNRTFAVYKHVVLDAATGQTGSSFQGSCHYSSVFVFPVSRKDPWKSATRPSDCKSMPGTRYVNACIRAAHYSVMLCFLVDLPVSLFFTCLVPLFPVKNDSSTLPFHSVHHPFLSGFSKQAEKSKEKLARRKAIAEAEELDPKKREQRLAENQPRTIESTKEIDPTIPDPLDDEVVQDEASDEFAAYFQNPDATPKILVTTSRRASANA